jgi:hypothetical protein
MCSTCEPLPCPLMGEGSGGGEDSTSSPPSQPSPTKGGRGIDLPLSASRRWICRASGLGLNEGSRPTWISPSLVERREQ